MITSMNGFLLDENSGSFVDNGRKIEFHNARFYDVQSQKLVKVTIPDGYNALPEPQVNCVIFMTVNAGEKYCKLVYDHYEL